MTLTEDTLRFINVHRCDDVRNLALQAHKYPEVDIPFAISQITGWQTAKEKIPAWADNEAIVYPPHLSMEQCSSEITACYKREIIRRVDGAHQTFADLTGGFGIDCAFISSIFKEATYVEQQQLLCKIAAHNFPLLGGKHINVCNADSIQHLQAMPPVDWIFIDPARRDGQGGKTIAICDCEPNVTALEETLLQKANHVLVKLSPMLDISLAINDLKHVQQVHIVSVNNECKELLLLLGSGEELSPDEVPISCINLSHAQGEQSLTFCRRQEKEYECTYTSELKNYLYEPNASILKAGAFRTLSAIYKIEKLHPNSHLYTSAQYISDFPGRKFKITGSCGFNKKELKDLLGMEKKANLTVRNFPSTVSELRKRLKLADGGNTYLFASTLADEKRVLIRCLQ